MSKKGWLITLIFTGIILAVWLYSVYKNTKPNVPVSPQTQDALEAVDPTFDQDTLKLVSQVTRPSLYQAPKPSSTPVPTPTPIPSPNPSPSLSPQVSATPLPSATPNPSAGL
jgi:hypothetical protein